MDRVTRYVPGMRPSAFDHVHERPDGRGRCAYMAVRFCDKCGWLDPKLIRGHWKPSVLAAFGAGVAFGAFLTALFLLTLLGGS